jgi:hypothetical protein
MNTVFLTRGDIKKIVQVLDNFERVEHFEISQDEGSGIGSNTSMRFAVDFKKIHGTLEVPVSGLENW